MADTVTPPAVVTPPVVDPAATTAPVVAAPEPSLMQSVADDASKTTEAIATAAKEKEAADAKAKAPEPKAKLDKDGKPIVDKDGKPVMEEVLTGAPETYVDFTLAKDVTIAPETLTEFQAAAKEMNLSQAGAQRLIDMATKNSESLMKKASDAQNKAWTDARTGWKAELASDPEIGGAKFAESKALAGKAVAKFGSPRLIAEVFNSGWGDHPELFKVFVKIGKSLGEDTAVEGAPLGSSEQSVASRLFKSMPGTAA